MSPRTYSTEKRIVSVSKTLREYMKEIIASINLLPGDISIL